MTKKAMNYGGIGPKLALLCLPYILLSLIVMFKYPEFLDLIILDTIYTKVAGFIWLGIGIVFYIYSALYFILIVQLLIWDVD